MPSPHRIINMMRYVWLGRRVRRDSYQVIAIRKYEPTIDAHPLTTARHHSHQHYCRKGAKQ
jgi:hypothetical protein